MTSRPGQAPDRKQEGAGLGRVLSRVGLVVAIVCGLLVPVPGVERLPWGDRLLAPAQASGGPTVVAAGDLTASTTWSPANSPYLLTGRLRVRAGATLTVLPGTIVKMVPTKTTSTGFNSSQILVLGGQLVARGTASQPIVVTSGADDGVGGDSNGDGGATTPQPGDWYNVAFDALSKDEALQMPTSVVENVLFKYGGEGSSACAYAEVSVAALGRVNIAHSEFRKSKSAGVLVVTAEAGVGIATLRTSLVADSACGMNVSSGSVMSNVVEASVTGVSLQALAPAGLQVYGNWFNGEVYTGPGSVRTDGDYRSNAFVGGVRDLPTGQDPQDLSDNWWGHVVDPNPSGCVVQGTVYIPAVASTAKSGSACYMAGRFDITGYFTKVLPALGSAPPVPDAGIGGAGGAVGIPDDQVYGSADSGSAYGARPVGTQADPVNTAVGAFVTSAADLVLPSLGTSLAVTRSYTSVDTSTGWFGPGWSFGYQMSVTVNGSEVVVRVGDGQRLHFAQQPDGSWVGLPGVTAILASQAGGGWVLTTTGGVRHSFAADGRLVSLQDRNGTLITFDYDPSGHLQTISSGSRSIGVAWTAAGDRLASATLPDGRHVDYGYTNGLLTSVADPGGKTVTYSYDTGNRLTTITAPSGAQVARLAYDANTTRVTDQWDALNHHSTFGWDAATSTATMTDPRGGVWTDVYQGNVLLRRTDPVGAVSSYEYNGDLQPVATTDARGTRSTLGYTTSGDLATFQGGSKAVTTTYNTDHLPTATVSGRGTRSTFAYDSHSRLTGVTRPDPAGGANQTTSYTYDAAGQTTSMTDARGKTTTYAYNAAGDLTSTTTAEGNTTTYGYDSTSRLITVTDPRGNVAGANPAAFTTTNTYDANNQLTAVTDPTGHTTTGTYNDDGQLISATDANLHTTTYTYDPAGHTTAVQGPDPAIPAATTSFDGNGNTATTTDPAGRTISYTYDLANRPTIATTPLGAYKFGYDPGGNMTTVTDPAGAKTSISYNAANQVAALDFPGTASDVTYSYDGNGNRSKMVDPNGTTTYTYDALDQLTKVTRGSNTFSYTYDAVGNETGLTYPDGTSYAYSYNNDNQLTKMVTGGTTQASYAYDPAGNQTTSTLADGTTSTRSYDALGQLTAIHDAKTLNVLLDESYTYDPVGNPTAVSRNNATSTDHYTYDSSDRLTQACFAATCNQATDYIRWAYNPADAITSETRPAGTTTNTYNTKGQLTTANRPTGTTTYTYNNLGQQTAAGATTYTYDTAGRTKTATTTAGTTTYTYDGDGRRLSSTLGSATTNSLWDPQSYQLALERDGSNTMIRRYSYGTEPIGLTTANNQNSYYHQDRLGSVRALTDSTGALQTSYDWEPYGRPKATTTTQGAPANPMQWLGQYSDSTGLYHLRGRQYDPTTSQFTTTDPASAAAFSSTYTYGAANPMVNADTNGLWPSRQQMASVNKVAGGIAFATGLAAGILACTGVGAPVAAVLGGVALFAGVITAASAAYIAYDTCHSGKGSCGNAVAAAAIETALVAAPEIRVARQAVKTAWAARTAAKGGSALADASSAAFKAAGGASGWVPSAKHLAGAGGRWQKFAEGADPGALAQEALRSRGATFLPNKTAGRFIVETDLGRPIGTKGETWLKVVVSDGGDIITGYPVKR